MNLGRLKNNIQLELKWASYYLAFAVIVSIVFALLEILLVQYSSSLAFPKLTLNLIVLVVCIVKCLQEKQAAFRLPFLDKLKSTFNLLAFYFLLQSLLFNPTSLFIIPKKDVELRETSEDLPETYGNSLKDLLAFIQKKLHR